DLLQWVGRGANALDEGIDQLFSTQVRRRKAEGLPRVGVPPEKPSNEVELVGVLLPEGPAGGQRPRHLVRPARLRRVYDDVSAARHHVYAGGVAGDEARAVGLEVGFHGCALRYRPSMEAPAPNGEGST